MSRRITRQRAALDRGSTAVEFSLMVAAMAAMILAVVLGIGRVVGEVLFPGCTDTSTHLSVGVGCMHPGGTDAPAAGQGADGTRSAAVTDDLRGSDDT